MPRNPRFNPIAAARRIYGPAFDPRDVDSYEEARADWADLTPAERSFTQCQLLYLNLLAQQNLGGRLTQVGRDLAESLAEGFDRVAEGLEALEELDEPDPADALDGDEPEGDGAFADDPDGDDPEGHGLELDLDEDGDEDEDEDEDGDGDAAPAIPAAPPVSEEGAP